MKRRLFEHKQPLSASAARTRETVREAVAQADLDDNARKLGELLGASQSVTPVEYARERHGRWLVEHGRAGDDYVFQLHPLKATTCPWQDIITGFIAAMDAVFPRTVQIHYRRPDEQWQVQFFTVRVDKVCALPGWEHAVRKAVDGLAAVAAWAASGVAVPSEQSARPGKRTADNGADE